MSKHEFNESKAFRSYFDIVTQMNELESKTDPESKERYMVLMEQLITADMGLAPMRKAMATGKKL